MVPELPQPEMPAWLKGHANSFGPLPLRQLLADSVFYPACEFDGKPLEHLAGNYFSFVYADYGVQRSAAFNLLTTFAGYFPTYVRDVTTDELAPNGWSRVPQAAIRKREHFFGLPAGAFFALWAILERSPDVPLTLGPDRCSLLYVGFEGVTTYRSIYTRNKVAPKVIAIVHPGGWGQNYTNFEDEGKELASAVCTQPVRFPPYLLNDWRGSAQDDEQPCWPTIYPLKMSVLPGELRLWGRPDSCPAERPFHSRLRTGRPK